jgi:hypothetical protein
LATKTEGYVVRRVYLAWGFLRREKRVRLSINSDSLEFDEGRAHTVLPLADIEELDLDIWPNVIVSIFWALVPWLWWYPANFSIRTSSGLYRFRVRNKYRNRLIDAALRSPNLRLKGVISTVEN